MKRKTLEQRALDATNRAYPVVQGRDYWAAEINSLERAAYSAGYLKGARSERRRSKRK